MDFVLDLLQGAGIAAAIGIRPFLPTLSSGALAAGDLGVDFDGTDFAFLEQPGSLAPSRSWSSRSGWRRAAHGRTALERGWAAYALLAIAGSLALLEGAGSMADAATPSGPAWSSGSRARRSGWSRACRCSPACAGASTPRPRARCRSTPKARRSWPRALDPLPAAGAARDRRARLAAARRPPARGREVRRPAHPAVKKLVLAVIDAMKPAMLERAVATGRAPALKLLIERRPVRRRLRRGVPVGHAGVRRVHRHRDRRRTAHEIPSMNWYHRGEERYVEYGTSFGASRAFGIKRSLTDTIYNMNLEHLSSDVETVFETWL